MMDDPVVVGHNAASAAQNRFTGVSLPALDKTKRRVYVHALEHASRFAFFSSSDTDWEAIETVYTRRRVDKVSVKSPSGAEITVSSPTELRDGDEIYVLFF